MDLTALLLMRQEFSLLAIIVILLIYDLFASEKSKSYFHFVGCLLFLAHTVMGFLPIPYGELFGGMYNNVPISNLVKSILNVGIFIVLLQAHSKLQKEDSLFKRGEFFVLMLSTLFGMYLMISSGNFLTFYLGLEIASLPMATLIAFDKYKNNSAEAGAKYVLSAALSSGILLFGLSFLYAGSGTMYFADFTRTLVQTPFCLIGFVFFVTGMFFKISMVPFHLWTADVYEGAPTSITAYMSVISKGSAVFVLTVLLYKVFAPFAAQWQSILWWVIVVTITVGNLFALRQDNLKRFLAFSSISQAGYIMLGIMGAGTQGMTATIYFILVYIFSNLAAFGVIAAIEDKTGKVKMSEYNGLYKTNPKLSLLMMFALFSLGGIPPLAGFFSKFFIFTAAASQGYYGLVLIALINTIISLYYYLLPVKAMFINKNDQPIEEFNSDNYSRLASVICLGGLVILGLVSYFYEYIGTLSFGM